MYPIKTFNFNSTYKMVKIRIGTCRNLTKKHKKNSKIEIMSRILEKEKKSKTKKYKKKYSYLKLKTIFLGKKNIVKIAKSPLEVWFSLHKQHYKKRSKWDFRFRIKYCQFKGNNVLNLSNQNLIQKYKEKTTVMEKYG